MSKNYDIQHILLGTATIPIICFKVDMSDSEATTPSKSSSEDHSDPDFMPPQAKKSRVNPSSASGNHPHNFVISGYTGQ